jgi:phosphatidyl-myo-inositol dimannoside synthase
MTALAQPAPPLLFLFTEVFANGGIQRFNQTLLDACSRLEIECTVLSLNDTAASIAKHSGWPNVSLAGFSGNRLGFARAAALSMLRGRYQRLVVGHINFLTLAAAIQTLRPFRRITSLLIAHGIEVWSGLNKARRHALSGTDRVLCVSDYTRRRILEQAPGLAADRLVIFPNALSPTWEQVAPLPLPPPAARFILSVTRLERGDRYKGIATVIEAFSMLEDLSLQYLIIGDGGDLSFLRMVAERCGVKERVHFLRGVRDSELIALYQCCDAFVLPSGKEGFGIVFLEAMFFGAPVIAAHEKGAIDVVRDGETGLSIRFGDTIAIKEAIERVRCDSGLREHLRGAGRAQVTGDGPFTFSSFQRRCADTFLGSDASPA